METIREKFLESSKKITIRNLEMTAVIDEISVNIRATVTYFGEWLGNREISTIVVLENDTVLGTLVGDQIYIAIDSVRSNKISKDNVNFKILELVKKYFFGEEK